MSELTLGRRIDVMLVFIHVYVRRRFQSEAVHVYYSGRLTPMPFIRIEVT